jgi:ATP-dependent helicase/nuclease subunit B
MLRVVTGRFHPSLESSLVDHLHRSKVDDPLVPIAILVPSKPLLDHIKRLLSIERRCSVLNVQVLTFHQFALRLVEEAQSRDQSVRMRVVDDLFFEQLVRYLVRSRLSDLVPLQSTGHASGTWAALWSTVRDLKDAGVDPVAAIRGITEGYFDKEDTDRLQALFSLHAAVKEVGKTLEVGTADDLAESLLPFLPSSSWLASFTQVVYYGFYDLTQVQLSLFDAVSEAAPTTLFFPLEEEASFGFAQRFFNRHVQPLVTTPDALTKPSAPPSNASGRVTLSLYSVIGPEEELASTCRTILDLVETNGYRFDEIGVVARTLDSYGTTLSAVFDRHCIPFTTNACRPLIYEPLCKTLLQLASLPTNDFYRATVLDVISSPLYRSATGAIESTHYRPEQWKMIVSALHITRGRDEWERLKQASHSALALDAEDDDAMPGVSLNVASEVTALCWSMVAELLEACEALPTRGTVGQLVDAFQQLVAGHLYRQEPESVEDDDPQRIRLHATWQAIDRAWATLRDLDAIGEELSWGEFVELLNHALERMAVPLDSGANQGVMVLDAMAARGLSFKALFLLGLNEKVFPRYIREDPFLRDRHRLVLDATLGFKIDEKLAGYDEEALLFALLCQAATQRLYLSFQRADDNGRLSAPSPYLAEGAKRLHDPDCPVETVPRRLTERVARRPSMRLLFPPSELACWMAMQGQDPAALLRSVGQDANLFTRAVSALDQIESDGLSLTAFDGQTGPLPSHWSRVMERGLAPTPLERYARCPFQYFAADVLHLDPVRLASSQEPDALLLGTLVHAAFRRCYEALVANGWPVVTLSDDAVRRSAEEAVAHAAMEREREHPPGHFLLWELAKEQVIAVVAATVASDQEVFANLPYQPIAFEKEATGTVSVDLQGESIAMTIRGRVDRLDRHRDTGALRIIDYKYKTGASMKPEDRNLRQSAARGFRLQPPFYARLDLSELGPVDAVQFLFVAPNWSMPIDRSEFGRSAWSGDGGALIQTTVNRLVAGLEAGRFFILPDNQYCKACDYRVACRHEHQLTWWRSHRAAQAKELRSLRSLKVNDE